ncbi:MAG: hypothetical protein P8R31_19590 [Mariniblastus sp.]|nr:hypothetical protein [Planctomycetaceae bacterium]MCP4477094.1 hypothetical protein [Planctomycetaceae bacterium]MDG1513907.1 hypothetical protein [Mariniblastus sp.]
MIDNGLDAIPIVGTVKGAYEIGDAVIDLGGSVLEGVDVDEEELGDKVWDDLEGDAWD